MTRINNLISTVILLCAMFILAHCGASKSSPLLSKNDVLIYNVNYGQMPQQLEIELLARTPDLVFSYMLGNNSNNKGKVTVTANALKNAHVQDNFWGGGDKNLLDKTAVWVSSDVFNDIQNKKTVEMPFRQGFTLHEPSYTVIDKVELNVHYNGKLRSLTAIYLEDTGNKGFKYWIWDNLQDPIILKMDLGWEFTLTQIIQPQTR